MMHGSILQPSIKNITLDFTAVQRLKHDDITWVYKRSDMLEEILN